jgi:hypothetical protein
VLSPLGWTEDAPAVRPPTHYNAAAAYDAARQEFVVYGGTTSAGRTDATWGYRLTAVGTVDETCTGKDDLDDDGALGCDDPDCWGACDPWCPPDTSCPPVRPSCGDGTCDAAGETASNCAIDCDSAACGDGRCGSGEDDVACALDCAICGDLRCSAGAEDALGCPVDCP